MEPKSQKKTDDKKAGRSFKKNIAMAAVAASLGLSLGVPVGDALAQSENMDSPPSYTLDDNTDSSSENIKSPLESRQGKFKSSIESRQGKFKSSIESRQGKFKSSLESRQGKVKLNQGKLETSGSTQLEWDKQLENELDAE